MDVNVHTVAQIVKNDLMKKKLQIFQEILRMKEVSLFNLLHVFSWDSLICVYVYVTAVEQG